MKRYLFIFQIKGESLIAIHQMELYFDSLEEVNDFIHNGNGYISAKSINPVSLFEIEDISEYLKSLNKTVSIPNVALKIPLITLPDDIER